jgi:hypothetical protein
MMYKYVYVIWPARCLTVENQIIFSDILAICTLSHGVCYQTVYGSLGNRFNAYH